MLTLTKEDPKYHVIEQQVMCNKHKKHGNRF